MFPNEVKTHRWRYFALAALFCAVCLFYGGRLFYMQVITGAEAVEEKTVKRRVTVQAMRGEIYDRNGEKLVENNQTDQYDLILTYNAFAKLTPAQKNETCLRLFEALNECGAELADPDRYIPFGDTVYPDYRFSDEAADDTTIIGFALHDRVLKDVGLKDDATAETVRDYYVSEYQLLAKGDDGKRLYNDGEVDRLIRLYYSMDAARFRNTDEFLITGNAGMKLMIYVRELNLSSVVFRAGVKRGYCHPGYASHILGTVGPIYSEEWEYYNEQGYQMNAVVGKSGCEAAFEQYLHGIDGVIEIEEDTEGNIISTTVIKPAVAGLDIRLTIDIDLQKAAEDGLKENVDYVVQHSGGLAEAGSGCNAGATVAMDPDTFEVLAIASYPTYDLTEYNLNYETLSADDALPLFNRALLGSYEPGSTYKLGVAMAALLEGTITPSSTVTCTGAYPSRSVTGSVGCSTYSNHADVPINVVRALAVSCNSFFSDVGQRLGIEKLNSYMKHFGIGGDTGFELGGITGMLAGSGAWEELHRGEGPWVIGNTWRASIGQADNQVSPLQLACYVSTLANGGTRYAARLLYGVYRFGGEEPEQVPETVVLDSFDSIPGVREKWESAQATVFEGMRQVVEGSATVGRWIDGSLPVTVGGKTGTAETSKPCENALFVCTAPYNDPEIVIATVLEQGYTGGYASMTAARILNAYYGND